MILTINGGSSSLKFGLFAGPTGQDSLLPQLLGSGRIERIAQSGSQLIFDTGPWGAGVAKAVVAPDARAAIQVLLGEFSTHGLLGKIAGVGHRIVHGGNRFVQPELISPEMLAELARISPFDPNHLPGQIALIGALTGSLPNIPQIACFDTAFHQEMPEVAKRLPLPRKYHDAGVRKYGFHGLSYEYLLAELHRLAGSALANGRVILAHLGAGASMAAVHGGKPIDTTMAFTPAAGLVMATRTGDIDPGIVLYLAQTEGMSAEAFNELVNKQSGLLGVSGISGDTRDLEKLESANQDAALALELFCYQARKTIGSLAAALGGLDALVFSGGIGEHAPRLRQRICQGLEFLGIEFDEQANKANAAMISGTGAKTSVWVLPTNEEVVMAKAVSRMLA